MKNLIVFALLLGCGVAQAATITIDFDDLPLGGTPVLESVWWSPHPEEYIEVITEDYRFLARELSAGVSDFFDPGGNKVISAVTDYDGDPGEINISRQDGAAFALYAADIFGATSYIAFSDDGDFSSSTGGPGLDQLGTGMWLNINSVHFYSAGFPLEFVAIDNVVLGSAVPVPAAVWLFGSGLGLLGWFRRRQTT